MSNRWVISDLHLGHTNCWAKFKNPDGSPLRPFSSTEEMDETMIERWNEVVKPQDTVYALGDIVINKRYLEKVKLLNGHKRLIRGNHDIYRDSEYRDVGFEQIWGVRVFVDKFIMSHIPLHPDSVTDRFRVNLHGHHHGNEVLLPDGSIDPRYFSCCVERINYTPIHFDDLEQKINERFKKYGYEPPKGYFNGAS